MSQRKRAAVSPPRQETKRPSIAEANDLPRPKFPSLTDAPSAPPVVRRLCEIISTSPASSVEAALDASGLRPSPEEVEEVLKLSYAVPAQATLFFRWVGVLLGHNQSPYAWNLVVDLLGRNLRFDAAWEAVRSMHRERTLSVATFASLFSSLVAAQRPDEALDAFLSMDSFGVPRDPAALNSLLSAACREGRLSLARDFLARAGVPPDRDSYAIFLECCEAEADPHAAEEVFASMVDRFGFDPDNVPAYDSLLTTLVRHGSPDRTTSHISHLTAKGCYPSPKFFRLAMDIYINKDDASSALLLWERLAGRNGCFPDLILCNALLSLLSFSNQHAALSQIFSEMVLYGVFPDSETYDIMLRFYLKSEMARNALVIFDEMVKNEFSPSASNCSSALRLFLDHGEWEAGIKVWKHMLASDPSPSSDENVNNANMLVLWLKDLDRLPEACKLAGEIIDRRIKLQSSTLSKLRTELNKLGKGNIYDELLVKWKFH